MRDIFQPRHEPARSIYEAFQVAARMRKGHTIAEWAATERDAVFHEAVSQAKKYGLRIPTMDDVVSAERSAMGHVDYGAKWAYRVTEAMQRPNVEFSGVPPTDATKGG